MFDFDGKLQERLMRYAAVDTQSDPGSDSAPSTAIQFDLLRMLEQELRQIGATGVELTAYGTVLAEVPGNREGPVIGFLAHVDTAPAYHAEGVKPVLHPKYDGGEIRFVDAADLVLSPATNAYLGEKIGDDIITAIVITIALLSGHYNIT